jgi:hypothetical protein
MDSDLIMVGLSIEIKWARHCESNWEVTAEQ